MYQFTNDCLIGIPEIDNEHEHLFELLNNVEEIGSNLEFYSSICGSPSILFNNISVAGNVN